MGVGIVLITVQLLYFKCIDYIVMVLHSAENTQLTYTDLQSMRMILR